MRTILKSENYDIKTITKDVKWVTFKCSDFHLKFFVDKIQYKYDTCTILQFKLSNTSEDQTKH